MIITIQILNHLRLETKIEILLVHKVFVIVLDQVLCFALVTSM